MEDDTSSAPASSVDDDNTKRKPTSSGGTPDPDVVDRIAKMVEWTPYKVWEYSNIKSVSPEEEALMAAQRFMAAQSFLMSWQRGKVPTGWLRPRRLADLEGTYTSEEIEAAIELVNRNVEEHNKFTTDRIKEIQAHPWTQPDQPPPKPITKAEIDDLKDAYQKFSSDLFDINTALKNASSAIAELTLRTQALAEKSVHESA